MADYSAKLCGCCCPTKWHKNKLAPAQDDRTREEGGEYTEVNMENNEDKIKTADSESLDPDSSTALSFFKNFFHASPDNKLAVKLYGKKSVLVEKSRQNSKSKWMIHPYSQFKWYWDLLVVTLLIFTVIVLPVSIAFYSEDQNRPEWLVINCCVDFLFITDIVINFRTGLVSSDDEIILKPGTVAKKYLRGWFLIDVLSSFPFDYVTLIFTRGQVSNSLIKASRAIRIIRMAKLLSLLRLLRISKLVRLLQRWEDLFDIAGGVLRILKLIMLMLLLSHWNGCIQYLVPYMQDIPRTSWIAINHLQNATVGEKYSWSFFKAISHMLCIGFGRWPPQNVTETWLTIISMMIGATFYALFIGNMSTLLLSIDTSGRLYSEKLSQVEEYMRYRKLPQHLRVKVQEFYEHRYRKKFFNEVNILEELSQGLKEDIINFNCRELIETVPFFQNASPLFVSTVLTKLKMEVFLKGEVIIHTGAKGDQMYFIAHGIVDVLTEDGKVATKLTEGSHFGEICLLTDDRRVATVTAETICDLFSLSKKNFQDLLEEFPEMRCALETIALDRLNKIGVTPSAEEITKNRRLATHICPPHIGKDVSCSGLDSDGKICNHVPGCGICQNPACMSDEKKEVDKLEFDKTMYQNDSSISDILTTNSMDDDEDKEEFNYSDTLQGLSPANVLHPVLSPIPEVDINVVECEVESIDEQSTSPTWDTTSDTK